MLGISHNQRAFVFAFPVDMRKGFDGLSSLVFKSFGMKLFDGNMFVFISRNRKRAKVLYWDGTGICILAKRMEQGKLSAPWRSDNKEPFSITMSELSLLLEGNELVGHIPFSPSSFSLK